MPPRPALGLRSAPAAFGIGHRAKLVQTDTTIHEHGYGAGRGMSGGICLGRDGELIALTEQLDEAEDALQALLAASAILGARRGMESAAQLITEG